ncbi:RHS repeat-associated core domain-containing protein [Actinopolymorpha pittospori]
MQVPRTEVGTGSLPSAYEIGVDGKPLRQAKPASVIWPSAGTATVDVPGIGKPARVGSTVVAVTAPKASAKTEPKATSTPERVSVQAYGNDVARKLGGHGTAFRLSRADGVRATGTVQVRVDVSGFADAFGGDFETRLRLISKPGCALVTPSASACATGTPVRSHVDLRTHTLVAEISTTATPAGGPAGTPAGDEAPPDPAGPVFVVAAAPSGETGSATATKLSSSSKWSVGLQSGDFNWTLPLPKVPAISGNAPEFDLSYSSQAVDGQVAAENNQPSWVGQGWDLALPFLERRYKGCADDGGDTADLCWGGDELRLSLEGTSSSLVKDTQAGGDTWRARQDPGWKVVRHRGTDNGDNDGEYWVVSTPQGTTYTFGRGKQATTGTQTDSVYTVPVFGDDSGEPCHTSSTQDSWCVQAWRWNLDQVVDAHGNSSTYFYSPEKNRYARNGNADRSTDYTAGGSLRDIVYSQRSGSEDVQAPARLHFSTQRRCVEAADGSGTCPAYDQDHATSYPDVPMDSLCTGRCTGEEQKAPTFFTGYLLRSVTAQRSGADGGWVDVDRLDLTFSFPKPSDGTSAALWLRKVQQSGLAGSNTKSLPAVEFTGKERVNRADADPGAGAPEMRKLRMTSVVDEMGRRVDVNYGQPHACPKGDLPPAYDTNTQDCFPGWRTNGDSSGFGVWNKHLVTRVTVNDTGGGSPPQITSYRYRGTPAWHSDNDPLVPNDRESWSDWRGYGSVDVVQMSDPKYRGEKASRSLSTTRTLFFRGMNGDRRSDGSKKSVMVTDSRGTSLTDQPYLRGKERETQQFALDAKGDPSYELGGSLKNYTSARTTPKDPGEADPDADAHLVVESDSASRETVIADDGTRTSRSKSLATSYDSYGQVISVLDEARTGDDIDQRCTKTSYARDNDTVDRWMLAFPYRVRTYAGSCDKPSSLVTGKDQYYDSSDKLGSPVHKGDVTRTVSARKASGPNTVTDTITTQATYDAYGRTLTETDAKGNVARTAFEPATGRPTTVTETNPLDQAEVTTLEPDRQQPVRVKDVNSQVTINTYDPLGRLTSVRQPEQAPDAPPAQVFSYDLDPAHKRAPLVTTKQLQSGDTYVTTWAFLDSLGRDRQSQELSPASTAEHPKTIVKDTRYDDAGHVAAEPMPVVAPGKAGSALLALPADEIDETRHTYDALGRDVKSTQYGQGKPLWSTTTEYFGDRTRVTPPKGGVVTTSWTDARGREIRKQDGTGAHAATTSYIYTPADKIDSSTDPEGHRASYTYDLLGQRIGADDPDAGKSLTSYDDNGNPLAVWDAKTLAKGGDTPTLSTDYDKLDRPVNRWAGASKEGRLVSSWSYDSARITNGVGQLADMTTYDGHHRYTVSATGYDSRGRITGKRWKFPAGLISGLVKDQTYTVTYGYDAADHLKTIGYPDKVLGAPAETLTTGYDDLGNPKTLQGTTRNPLTGRDTTTTYISDTSYASDGKIAGRDYANPHHPLRRAYGYDAESQRLTHVQTLVGGPGDDEPKAKQDDTYRWDPAGNLTSLTDNALPKPVATCFSYDDLSRLAHAWTTKQTDCGDSDSTHTHDGPAGFNSSWTYTGDGNIASRRSLLQGTTKYDYTDPDHPHAVTKAGAKSFKYDTNGAMDTKVKLGLVPTTMDWDAQHQLTSVTTEHLLKTKFVYAPDGTRLARVDPTGTATLYIDGQEITLLLGVGLTAKATRFYQIADTTVAERVHGIFKWQFNDMQGSAQIAVPKGTSLVERTYYDPYGDIRPGSAPPVTDHGFLGKVKDPTTGLNALGARYYDADLGRFISTDPASDPASAQTLNPYSYGANNPIIYADPTGLWSLSGAWNSVKKGVSAAADWASEHKGLIANVAVGIGVGIAVGAVCATGVGCLVLAGAAAGAAGAAAGYGVDVAEGKQEFSWGGLASNVAVGAVTGAATAGLAKGAGALAKTGAGALARSGAGQAAKAAATTAGRAVSNTARSAATKVAASGAGKAAASATSKVAQAAKSAGRSFSRAARPAAAQTDDAAAASGASATSAASNAARPPARIFSARVLNRAGEEPGPFHNFPGSFDETIFSSGNRTVNPGYFNKPKPGLSNDSVQYRLPGSLNGRNGVYEIFTRPSLSGRTEVIMHRFFNPRGQ